jgi:hypothetical protein
MILVDTNVLCRVSEPLHSMSGLANTALAKLKAQGADLVIVP